MTSLDRFAAVAIIGEGVRRDEIKVRMFGWFIFSYFSLLKTDLREIIKLLFSFFSLMTIELFIICRVQNN